MFREGFPIVSTPDLPRAMRFYVDVLGFREEYRFPGDGEPDFVSLALHELKLGLGRDPEAGAGRDFALWFYTDDVDAAVEHLRALDVEVRQEPQDMPWGERVAAVADPDGRTVYLGAAVP